MTSYDVRFPVILPQNSWVTKLLVNVYHEKGNHATGTNQTLAALYTKYWILSGREVIREWEKECAECRRRKTKPCQQIMWQLPTAGLKTSLRAFARSAVDLSRFKDKGTAAKTVSLPIHSSGYDGSSFRNGIRIGHRLVPECLLASRRGLPEEMFSNNGINLSRW